MTSTTFDQPAVRLGNRLTGPIEPWPFQVIEPATGAPLAKLVGGGSADASLAVDHAATAFRDWSATATTERAAALRSIASALREEATARELAVLVTRETGKRLVEAAAEVSLSAAFFDWFATAISARTGELWHVVPGLSHQVSQYPLGVVAVLTPWNFPVSIPARKIAPALAAGCTLTFKPSEVAPLSSLRLAEVVEGCIPTGVLNTVVGDPRAITNTWITDPRVRGLTFTGSTAVGKAIAGPAASELKRCVLELGGNAPFIVLDDADLDRAIGTLVATKYRNNGQSCIAANSAWVPRDRLDNFVDAFMAKSQLLVLGDPLDETTTLGPLAPPSDADRVARLLDDAQRQGATVIRTELASPGSSHFCLPAVCIDPPRNARLATEEIFGPALAIFPYDELDEVIDATRNCRHGLAAYVTGRDVDRAVELGNALDVGIVGVNSATPNTPQVPFGGLKDSGIGSEGGQAGLDAFLTYRTVAYGPA
ncbi:MAG: aldehyde dehydrogenase family protein [Acidimicrobiales bacterium]